MIDARVWTFILMTSVTMNVCNASEQKTEAAVDAERLERDKLVTELYAVVREPAKLKAYLDKGGDALCKNYPQQTWYEILGRASRETVREEVELLLAHGVKLDASDKGSHDSALNSALLHRHSLEIVELLLKAGANVNARSIQCYSLEHVTPLHTAARDANCDLVALLLAHGADVNANVTNSPYGAHSMFPHAGTPLHLALCAYQSRTPDQEKKVLKTLSLLLDKGAQVNARDSDGKTALHYAVTQSEVELLLSRGADPFAVDAHRRSPQGGTLESVQLLAQKGANVNERDGDGRTRLHGVQRADVAEWLIAQGVNPNQGDSHDMTPLHLASNLDTIKVLVAHSADVNAKDDKGCTPLFTSSRTYNLFRSSPLEIAKFLVSKGANVNAVNKDGNTVLLEAAGQSNDDLIRFYIENGADVNAVHNTQTVWKYVERKNDSTLLELLKKHAAKK